MAIISSIKHYNITNEYNEGANYFRRFLQYAENVSTGNMQTARTILDSLIINKKNKSAAPTDTIVAKEIKEQLQKRGYEVAEQVGQSDFKCSLAVKVNEDDEEYTISILVDDEKHYNNPNLIEQYFQRPDILQVFGWQYIHVFAKDWLQDPGKVIDQILKRIKDPLLYESHEEKDILQEHTVDNITKPEHAKEPEIKQKVPGIPVLPGFENLQFEKFIFQSDTSNKFWEAGVQENKLVIRFGKNGTKGQMQVKTFPDATSALKEKDKMIQEKTEKGYRRA